MANTKRRLKKRRSRTLKRRYKKGGAAMVNVEGSTEDPTKGSTEDPTKGSTEDPSEESTIQMSEDTLSSGPEVMAPGKRTYAPRGSGIAKQLNELKRIVHQLKTDIEEGKEEIAKISEVIRDLTEKRNKLSRRERGVSNRTVKRATKNIRNLQSQLSKNVLKHDKKSKELEEIIQKSNDFAEKLKKRTEDLHKKTRAVDKKTRILVEKEAELKPFEDLDTSTDAFLLNYSRIYARLHRFKPLEESENPWPEAVRSRQVSRAFEEVGGVFQDWIKEYRDLQTKTITEWYPSDMEELKDLYSKKSSNPDWVDIGANALRKQSNEFWSNESWSHSKHAGEEYAKVRANQVWETMNQSQDFPRNPESRAEGLLAGWTYAKTKAIEAWKHAIALDTLETRVAVSDKYLKDVYERFGKMVESESLKAYLEWAGEGEMEFKEYHRKFPVVAQLLKSEDLVGVLSSPDVLGQFDMAMVKDPKYLDWFHETIGKDSIVLEYLKKMEIEASTRSVIHHLVDHSSKYVTIEEPFVTAESLLYTLRQVHRKVNATFQTHLSDLYGSSHGSCYVHSGGNLIVLLASMLLYLGVDESRERSRDSLMEHIKERFYRKTDKQTFVDALREMVQTIPSFLPTLISLASKLSDIDMLFMTPEEDIQRLDSPFLKAANEASVLVLRGLISDPKWVPFFGDFVPYEGRVPFFCRTVLRQDTLDKMAKMIPVVSLPQTSNLIHEIQIMLNRLKMKPIGGNEHGELLDLCMACLQNTTYFDKLVLYLLGDYYTIEMVLGDLDKIVGKGKDDKFEKRVERLDFLRMIQKLPDINVLFRIIGQVISNE